MMQKLKIITLKDKLLINSSKDLFEIMKGILIYQEKFKFKNINKDINIKLNYDINKSYFDNLIVDEYNNDKYNYINDSFVNLIQLRIRNFLINEPNYLFYQLEFILKILWFFNNNEKKINNSLISKLTLVMETFLINNEISVELKYELVINFLENIKKYYIINYQFFETMIYFLYYNLELLKNNDKFRFINICFKFNFLISENENIILNSNFTNLSMPLKINILKYISFNYLKNYGYNNNTQENTSKEIIIEPIKDKIQNLVQNLIKENIQYKYYYDILLIKDTLKEIYSDFNNWNLDKNKIIKNKVSDYNYFEFDIKKHLDYCKINYEYQIYINDYISIDFLVKLPHKSIILEVNGPVHYYKNTSDMTSKTMFKTLLLKKLGYNIINMSYEEWYKNKGIGFKNEYLWNLFYNNLKNKFN